MPWARRRLKKIDRQYGISYAPDQGAKLRCHTLDIYRPDQDSTKKRPAILYIHGGGFKILSKETHWGFGLMYAEAGYIVFNINYRLAPEHPCPAGLEDVTRALMWILDHGAEYGADIDRLSIAGESAGGNLAVALALITARPAQPQWAQDLYRRQWTPASVMPACGFLDVSGGHRRIGQASAFVLDRIAHLSRCYLERGHELNLADPLLELESNEELPRPLPPFLITAGTHDPIYRDSERLHRALKERGVTTQLVLYPNEMHAFNALIWTPRALQCWRDHFQFLERYVLDLHP